MGGSHFLKTLIWSKNWETAISLVSIGFFFRPVRIQSFFQTEKVNSICQRREGVRADDDGRPPTNEIPTYLPTDLHTYRYPRRWELELRDTGATEDTTRTLLLLHTRRSAQPISGNRGTGGQSCSYDLTVAAMHVSTPWLLGMLHEVVTRWLARHHPAQASKLVGRH